MRSRFVKVKRRQMLLRNAHLAIAALATLIAAEHGAGATDRRGDRSVETIDSPTAGDPVIAIVSLRSQRITVYDAKGPILRAPVSSGQKGRETPAGVFSIIQKDADHYSNLYDDAFMPHMQRITWSGIALHGGALPGYPASHGCVRLPYDFAARLFDATPMGLRVIVAPADVAPVEIAHPALFVSKPRDETLVAARTAEANEAASKADQARSAAGKAFREVSQAMVPVRVAENLRLRADSQLSAAETALGSATSTDAKEQAERAKAEVLAKITDLQAQLAAAKAELQPKLDAVTLAREFASVAETARIATADAARQVVQDLEPVSVLISRKTQRLYVRQGFQPILDSPVTILDADRPIGTHVFTAIGRTDSETILRWNVVSLDGRRLPDSTVVTQGRTGGGRKEEARPMPADSASAKDALDRIVIPQDTLDRISGIAPRSSLIITDEGISSETGKGTDFVVLLSGEPQGGIKSRRRSPEVESSYPRARDHLPFWRSPSARSYSTW